MGLKSSKSRDMGKQAKVSDVLLYDERRSCMIDDVEFPPSEKRNVESCSNGHLGLAPAGFCWRELSLCYIRVDIQWYEAMNLIFGGNFKRAK